MSNLGPLLALALLGVPQEPARQPHPFASVEERQILREALTGQRELAVRVQRGGMVEGDAPIRSVIRHTIQISRERRIMLEIRLADPVPDGEAPADIGFGKGIRPQAMTLTRDNFDRIVFDSNEQALVDFRAVLHEKLDARIQQLYDDRPPTGRERQILELAGTGDIERFLARVEAARAEFEIDRQHYQSGMAAAVRLESLAVEYRKGPFGPGSLFSKSHISKTSSGR